MAKSVDYDIELSVGLNTDDITSQLDDLKSKIEDIFKNSVDTSSWSEMEQSIQRNVELATQLRDILTQVNEAMSSGATFSQEMQSTSLSTNEANDNMSQVVMSLENINELLMAIEEKFQVLMDFLVGFATGFMEGQEEAEEMDDSIARMVESFTNLSDMIVGFGVGLAESLSEGADNTENMREETERTGKAWKVVKNSVELVKKVIFEIWDGVKKITSGLVALGGKLVNAFRNMASNASSSNNSLKSMIPTILGLTLGVQSLSALIRKLGSEIRSSLTEAIKVVPTLKSQFDEMKHSVETLKAQLGMAFTPLIEAAVPALNIIIGKLADALSIASQFIAVLTGAKTWRRAVVTGGAGFGEKDSSGKTAKDKEAEAEAKKQKKIAEANKKADKEQARIDARNAKALERYAKQQEKAAEADKKRLSGLDILNNMTSQETEVEPPELEEFDRAAYLADLLDDLDNVIDTASGAGGGTNITYVEEQIDQNVKDFADWLKDMWDKADFTELGEKIGKTLKNFLDKIPWTQIQATADKLGKSLATLLNGFIEVEGLGYKIGKTGAEMINTAFHFLNKFVHNFHWQSLGKYIAEKMNGLFENIDWKLIKDTFVTGVEGLANFINSWIETFHWDNISNTLINAIDTIVSSVIEFFGTVKWDELGINLADQINKTLEGTNWEDVGKGIGSIVNAITSFLVNLVKNIKWSDVISAIFDIIKGLVSSLDWEDLASLVGILLQGALLLKVPGLLLTAVKGIFSKVFTSSSISGSVSSSGNLAAGTFANSFKTTMTTDLSTYFSGGNWLSKVGKAGVVAIAADLGANIGTAIGGAIATAMGADEDWVASHQGFSGMCKAMKEMYDEAASFVEMRQRQMDSTLAKDARDTAANLTNSAVEITTEISNRGNTAIRQAVRMSTEELGDTGKTLDDIRRLYEENKISVDAYAAAIQVAVLQSEGFNKVAGYMDATSNIFATAFNIMTDDDRLRVGDQYIEGHTALMKMSAQEIVAAYGNVTVAADGYASTTEQLGVIEQQRNTTKTSVTIQEIADAYTSGKMTLTQYLEALEDWKTKNTVTTDGVVSDVKEGMTEIDQSVNDTSTNIVESTDVATDALTGPDGLTGAFEEAGEAAEGVGTEITTTVANEILEGSQDVVDAVVTMTDAIFQTFTDELEYTDGRCGLAVKVGESISTGLAEGLKTSQDVIRTVLNSLSQMIVNSMNNLNQNVTKSVRDMIDKIKTLESAANGSTKSTARTYAVKDAKVAHLATGTVVPPNREFLAMLGDNKEETEIVSPLSTMKQAFMEAMSSANMGGGSSGDIVVQIDGYEVFRAVQKQSDTYKKRTGNYAFG